MKKTIALVLNKPIAILLMTVFGLGGCSDDFSSLNAVVERLEKEIAELKKPSKEEKTAELARLRAQVKSLEKELVETGQADDANDKHKAPSTTGASAYGMLTFNGEKIPQAEKPKFWFLNTDNNTVPNPRVEYDAGSFSIFGLPSGHYTVETTVYMNRQSQPYTPRPPVLPGDMTGSSQFIIQEKGGTEVDIEVAKLMHMTKPEDNANYVHGGDCGSVKAFQKPPELTWEPVMDGATYSYRVITADCEPFKLNNPPVVSGQTRASSVSLPLGPNQPGQIYLLHLSAYKNGKAIGTLETYGQHFRAWDYRFRIGGQ